MGLPQQKPLTVADYMGANDDSRWELIDGVAYDMSPAPVIKHQLVQLGVAAWLRSRFCSDRHGGAGTDHLQPAKSSPRPWTWC